MNFHAGQGLLQLGHASVGDFGFRHIQVTQAGECLQVPEARVCDGGAKEIQVTQPPQGLQILQAGIRHLRVLEMERKEIRQEAQMRQVSVSDFRRREVEFLQARNVFQQREGARVHLAGGGAKIGLPPIQSAGDLARFHAALRQLGDGLEFRSAELGPRGIRCGRGGFGGGLLGGPGCALRDPVAQGVELRFGKRLALGRHEVVVVRRERDAAVEVALGGVARHDDRAVLAAFQRGLAGVEAQLALLFFRPVTFEADLLEDGPDVLVEINGSHGVACREPGQCGQNQRGRERVRYSFHGDFGLGVVVKQRLQFR